MLIRSILTVDDSAVYGKLQHVITVFDEELAKMGIEISVFLGNSKKVEEYQDTITAIRGLSMKSLELIHGFCSFLPKARKKQSLC